MTGHFLGGAKENHGKLRIVNLRADI